MQWEYVKGSESDFENAPDWATLVTDVGNRLYFAEGHYLGAKIRTVSDEFVDYISESHDDLQWPPIIAERRPAMQTRVNDGRLAEDVETLIAERGTRYGDFKDGAEIMQQLKDIMKSTPKWENLKPSQKEALEMIQHKIGRILNGDPDYDDNWKDIAGYATLIAKEL